jgi:hypothetical protein
VFLVVVRWTIYIFVILNSVLKRAGGARKAALLQLMLVFVVVARWSKYIFLLFIIFGAFSTAVMIINR